MTKVIIIGEEPKKGKKKPIEFLFDNAASKDELCFQESFVKPKDYDNIELVARALNECYYDIMFAYDDNERSGGAIFLGHFNDGVVK